MRCSGTHPVNIRIRQTTGWRWKKGALFSNPPRQQQNQMRCSGTHPVTIIIKQLGADGKRVSCSGTHPVNNRIKCAVLEPTPSTTESNALFSNPPRQHQNQANNGVEMEKGCAVLGPTLSTTESNALFSNPPRQHQNQANNGVEMDEGCAVLGPTPSTTEAGKRRATDSRLNFFPLHPSLYPQWQARETAASDTGVVLYGWDATPTPCSRKVRDAVNR